MAESRSSAEFHGIVNSANAREDRTDGLENLAYYPSELPSLAIRGGGALGIHIVVSFKI